MPQVGVVQCLQKQDGTYAVSINGRHVSMRGLSRSDVDLAMDNVRLKEQCHDFYIKGSDRDGNMYGVMLFHSFDRIWRSEDIYQAIRLFIEAHGHDFPMKYVVVLTKDDRAVFASWLDRENKMKYKEVR